MKSKHKIRFVSTNLVIDDIFGLTYEIISGEVYRVKDIVTGDSVELSSLDKKRLEAFWGMKK